MVSSGADPAASVRLEGLNSNRNSLSPLIDQAGPACSRGGGEAIASAQALCNYFCQLTFEAWRECDAVPCAGKAADKDLTFQAVNKPLLRKTMNSETNQNTPAPEAVESAAPQSVPQRDNRVFYLAGLGACRFGADGKPHPIALLETR
jgi:hypothetical protein